METFRSSVVFTCVAVALACTSPAGEAAALASPAPLAATQSGRIEHVSPARDSVCPVPKRFEWTAVEGADRYAMELSNDIDMLVFSHDSIRGMTLEMPAGAVLAAGTYFWRVTAARDGCPVGDSGRAAFVVRE